MDLFELGREVKRARRASDMSQSALSAKTGVSRSRIDALENERGSDMTFKNVLRLLNALNLDLRVTTFNRRRPTLEDLQAEDAL